MKIVYILTRGDSIGGVQVHVHDLTCAMQRAGHTVTVLLGGEGNYLRRLDEDGISYRTIPSLCQPIAPRKDLAALQEIRQQLHDLRPDLLSLHSSKAGILGRIAARSLHIPTVFTAHGWSFTDGVPPKQAWLYKMAEKACAPLTDKIISVSEYDRQLAIAHHICPPQRITAIHNGMPNSDISLANPDNSPVQMTMIARFQPQKDHRTLFQALSVLPQDWQLSLIGDGAGRAATEQISESSAISPRVHFLGELLRVDQQLASSQLYVLISNWEGFPRSILEAMRAGLPVVASDVGGVREAVIDGVTGYLVPRGNVEVLRDRLERLINDPTLRKTMGDAGRQRFIDHFTIDKMVDKTHEIYRQIIQERNRRKNIS